MQASSFPSSRPKISTIPTSLASSPCYGTLVAYAIIQCRTVVGHNRYVPSSDLLYFIPLMFVCSSTPRANPQLNFPSIVMQNFAAEGGFQGCAMFTPSFFSSSKAPSFCLASDPQSSTTIIQPLEDTPMQCCSHAWELPVQLDTPCISL